MSTYIIIERQYDKPLAIQYNTTQEANDATTDSLFIDGLCEEDCLDLWIAETYPPEAELIIPPEDDIKITHEPNP